METISFLLTAIAGLILGSFFTVLIHRLPAGRSIVSPRSACPQCGAAIVWRHNIPLLSYLALRGRCAACRNPIPFFYPLVEGATAAALVFFAWASRFFNGGEIHWHLAGTLLLSASMIPVIVIDAKHRIIPDEISLTLIGLGIAASLLPGGLGAWMSLFGILAGGGVLTLTALLGEWLFHKEGMGGGDIKLLAAMGAFVGPWPLVPVLLVGSLSALATVVMQGPPFRGREIAFGPHLAVGLWATLFLMFRTDWLLL